MNDEHSYDRTRLYICLFFLLMDYLVLSIWSNTLKTQIISFYSIVKIKKIPSVKCMHVVVTNTEPFREKNWRWRGHLFDDEWFLLKMQIWRANTFFRSCVCIQWQCTGEVCKQMSFEVTQGSLFLSFSLNLFQSFCHFLSLYFYQVGQFERKRICWNHFTLFMDFINFFSPW